MDSRMFDDAAKLASRVFIICACLIPFALWKLVDICIWLYNNVNVTFGA